MADNTSYKTTYIKKTGSEITSNSYQVDVSSLLDSTSQLSSSTADQDEIVIVRKFDHTGMATHAASPITSAEAWSAWTLPNTNESGSTMYSISEGTITFSETAADYTWTTTQSGRADAIVLPSIAAADTIYILRNTFSLSKLVTCLLYTSPSPRD